MPKKEVVRKKFRVDPDKLERARAFLGAESDTETINKALDHLLRSAPAAEKKKVVRPAPAKSAPTKASATSKRPASAPDAQAGESEELRPYKRPPVQQKPAFAPKTRRGR